MNTVVRLRHALGTTIFYVLFAGLPAHGEVYRCTAEDGRITYTDRPCRQQEQSSALAAAPNALNALIGPWQCEEPAQSLAPQAIDSSRFDLLLEEMPPRQRASFIDLVQAIALGTCRMHGGGCAGMLDVYLSADGVVFLCSRARRLVEVRILIDGRAYTLVEGEDGVTVFEPGTVGLEDGRQYRLGRDGIRLDADD